MYPEVEIQFGKSCNSSYQSILPKKVGHEDVMNHFYVISILALTLDYLYLISIRCLCTDKHFIRIASKSEYRLGFGLMVLPPVTYPTLLQHASYHWNISFYISKIIPTKAYMDPLDDHGLFDFYFLIMWPVPNHDQTDEERNQRTRLDMSFRIRSGSLAKFIVW